jgi:hypothetical protein
MVAADRPDRPGVRLTGVDLSFSSSASADRWRALLNTAGITIPSSKQPGDENDYAASFTALPQETRTRSIYLSGGVHPRSDNIDEAHWHLTWVSAPDDQPPAQLVASSAAIGGYPKVLETLVDNWPGNKTVTITAYVGYSIGVEMFKRFPGRRSLRFRSVRIPTGDGQRVAPQDSATASWEIDPPIRSLTSLSAVRYRKSRSLVGTAQFGTTLSANLFDVIDNEVWSSIAVLLGDG